MTALDHAKKLVSFDTVSRLSNVEISDHVDAVLRSLGFETERIDYEDRKGVPKSNVLGRIGPSVADGLAYFGHTDVVPADDWKFTGHGPFEPTVKDGRLYGRGSCDMKGSVACMLAAVATLDASKLQRPVYVVCTADEEVGYGGALQVVERSATYGEIVESRAHGIIGEPTLLEVVHAHKGGCGMVVTAHGEAAHSSTAHGRNANLDMIPFLGDLKGLHDEAESDPQWRNDDFDPPTVCMNIGVNDHTRAVNVKPPQSVCTIYLRPMPGVPGAVFRDRILRLAERHGLETQMIFEAEPMWTPPDTEFVRTMLDLAGREKSHTVGYGTDGGAFTAVERKVVFGPGSIAQAHTHDEWIALDQLEKGTAAFVQLIEHFCL